MAKRSELDESAEELRRKIIGFGDHSGRKSFYPELRSRLSALEFLSQASVRLASSLDTAATLQSLTEMAVPFLGDLCALCACASDGSCARQLLACRDPGHRALAEKLFEDFPLAALAGGEAANALPRLLPDAPSVLDAMAGDDPDRRDLVRELGLCSAMTIPLVSGGRRLGILLVATAGAGRRYGPFDLELATEFGHRAALALENASLLLKAQEAARLKDEFLAILSHELRTPLTAILGWMGMVRSKRLDPATLDRGLAVVERNARVLAQIIDDLLGVSRIIAGKFDIHSKPVDLAPVMEAAVDALRPSAESTGIVLQVRCEPGVPAVMGDAKRLQQVVWNLVSNAVKYTPEGGEVRVSLARAGPSAKITVSDTGRGISPEFLPHVFERFRQADSSNTRLHGGLGLGLAIVRHLVELHSGSVQAASQGKGRGAFFTVTLPLASGQTLPASASPEPELPRLEDMRILLVEDDPDTLDLLGEILERQGARVVRASSAKRALFELGRAVPDLVISDIAMPEEDGVALVKAMRARGCQVPAVALSALARDEDRDRALAAGFQRYLIKPIDPRELLRAIASRHTVH
jgi:signal transduction histidine kinase